MAYEQITIEDRDDVRVIGLSRPDRLNAWTPRMHDELVDAFREALALVQHRELTALDQADATPEHPEAIAGVLEKRPPEFRR